MQGRQNPLILKGEGEKVTNLGKFNKRYVTLNFDCCEWAVECKKEYAYFKIKLPISLYLEGNFFLIKVR